MLSSELKHLITIQKGTNTKGTAGGLKTTFSNYFNVYAKKVVKNFQNINSDQNTRVSTTVEWYIRYTDLIDYTCRIYYNNEAFKIEHIEEIERKKELKITTTKYQNN